MPPMEGRICLRLPSRRQRIVTAVFWCVVWGLLTGLLVTGLLMLAGCATQAAVKVADHLRSNAQAGLMNVNRDSSVQAQGDAMVNDTFTLRLAVSALVIVALTYPVGKLLWLAGTRLPSASLSAGRRVWRRCLHGGRAGRACEDRNPGTRRTGPCRSPGDAGTP